MVQLLCELLSCELPYPLALCLGSCPPWCSFACRIAAAWDNEECTRWLPDLPTATSIQPRFTRAYRNEITHDTIKLTGDNSLLLDLITMNQVIYHLPFLQKENVIHLNKILFCVAQPFQYEMQFFLLHRSLISILHCTSEIIDAKILLTPNFLSAILTKAIIIIRNLRHLLLAFLNVMFVGSVHGILAALARPFHFCDDFLIPGAGRSQRS